MYNFDKSMIYIYIILSGGNFVGCLMNDLYALEFQYVSIIGMIKYSNSVLSLKLVRTNLQWSYAINGLNQFGLEYLCVPDIAL